jgi:hypothetical protein
MCAHECAGTPTGSHASTELLACVRVLYRYTLCMRYSLRTLWNLWNLCSILWNLCSILWNLCSILWNLCSILRNTCIL